jgi:4-amino-4-deoxy-L-arabinose transferase-like glycosyltransferase
LVGVAALAIRLTAINRFSYWLDEVQEVFTIRAGWGRMLHALREQLFNPPLDYVFQKTFDMLGPSDAARRILPALWGAGCVVVLGRLVARRADPRVGLVTALCLAFAPFHVHYSQEVRPYSLGMFLTALTLLLLDRYLEKPGGLRLIAALATAVAVAYTMLLAALVLSLAGGALVVDDALTGSAARRSSARRLLRWSPALILLIALVYLPWLPPVWRLLKAPPFTPPPAFAVPRVSRLFSYFGFGFHDWYPLGRPGALFIALVAAGAILAVTTYRLRFLFVWAIVSAAAIEVLEERHGAWDSIFHFLPAGVALAALATLPIGWLTERRSRAWLAPIALAIVLVLDARALAFYFRRGRPDWRPVADFLRAQPRDQAILVAGAATQLCVGYYVNGPDWLCCSRRDARPIVDVGADAAGLSTARATASVAWLVTPQDAVLQAPDSREDEGILFPTADRGVLVRRIAGSHQN